MNNNVKRLSTAGQNHGQLKNGKVPKACVLVLGDIGRSPRMQYHALSLAKEGYFVDLIGYQGSRPHKQIVDNEKINLKYMKHVNPNIPYLPKLIMYIIKTWIRCISILINLPKLSPPDILLVQNPPSIPTLPICWLYCLMFRSKFIIDWHNYGFTILSFSVGERHLLVKMTYYIEKFFSRRSSVNLCVTKAMREDLLHNWKASAVTLYDKPAEIFRSVSISEKHDLFSQLSSDYSSIFGSSGPDKTMFTERFADGRINLCEDRPGLVVSSTSWTEDEDFTILLDALQDYEEARDTSLNSYPPLIVIITGKGPMKEYYCQVIQEREWRHVQLCTPWLAAEDYPLLLACAEVGVCLHSSTSGLDLPMKVLDMFGCLLPVCALRFNCIEELVKPDQTGFLFSNSAELSDLLKKRFYKFPHNEEENRLSETLRQNLNNFQRIRWHDQWRVIALPLFDALL